MPDTTPTASLDALLSACLEASLRLQDAPRYELRAECDDEAIAGILYDLGPGRLLAWVPFGPRGFTAEQSARILAQCVMDRRIRVPDEIAARIERGEVVRPCR